MNVEQIVDKAQNFDYNPLVPLKYWFRTAGTLLKEVNIMRSSTYGSNIEYTGRNLRA